MQSLKNLESRQMPKTKEICSTKSYSDILYSWLQLNSTWDGEEGHPRMIAKSIVNLSKLGNAWDVSRQTLSKRLKYLKDEGLVYEDSSEPGYYFIKILPRHWASLVPYRTLKQMNDTLNEHCISTYVYLLNRYIASDQSEYIFTITEIKSFLGLSINTRSNDDTVKNILKTLSLMGLLKYEVEVGKSDVINGNIKTIHKMKWMTNVVKEVDENPEC